MDEQNQTIQFRPHPRIEDVDVSDGYRHYHATIKSMKMIRQDGKNIVFTHGFFETLQSGDIDYLDKEIDNGNMHIRKANHDEIRAAHYRRDPKAVLIEDIKNDKNIMDKVREEVEAELRRKYGLKPDDLKLAGVDAAKGENIIKIGDTTVTLQPKLQPVSTADLAGISGSNSGSK